MSKRNDDLEEQRRGAEMARDTAYEVLQVKLRDLRNVKDIALAQRLIDDNWQQFVAAHLKLSHLKMSEYHYYDPQTLAQTYQRAEETYVNYKDKLADLSRSETKQME